MELLQSVEGRGHVRKWQRELRLRLREHVERLRCQTPSEPPSSEAAILLRHAQGPRYGIIRRKAWDSTTDSSKAENTRAAPFFKYGDSRAALGCRMRAPDTASARARPNAAGTHLGVEAALAGPSRLCARRGVCARAVACAPVRAALGQRRSPRACAQRRGACSRRSTRRSRTRAQTPAASRSRSRRAPARSGAAANGLSLRASRRTAAEVGQPLRIKCARGARGTAHLLSKCKLYTLEGRLCAVENRGKPRATACVLDGLKLPDLCRRAST
eukprot:6194904-Pleurochrysis_carterae.AAC.2